MFSSSPMVSGTKLYPPQKDDQRKFEIIVQLGAVLFSQRVGSHPDQVNSLGSFLSDHLLEWLAVFHFPLDVSVRQLQ